MSAVPEQTPSARIIGILDGAVLAQLVQIVSELGVADLIDDRPVPVTALAERTSTNRDALYRALRTLAAAGVFSETEPGAFGLTPPAEALRTDSADSVRDIARMRAGREHWRSWGELDHSVRTGESAFWHAHGTNLWRYLAENPQVAELYDRAMGNNAQQVHEAVVAAFDFSEVRKLVDLGGGQGNLLLRLLHRHPSMYGVVLDHPHTAAAAERMFAVAGLGNRAKAIAGDFFKAVPGKADMYVLSRILHDWDDDTARTILSNVRDAMPTGAQLAVVDSVVPEGDASHPSKIVDIIMLALNQGRERTEAEFTTLFAATGLRHVGTWHTDAPISVVLAEAA